MGKNTEKKVLDQQVQDVAKAAAVATVEELKKSAMLKDKSKTPFQKTEALLYNYKNFKRAVKEKEEQIRTIREEGVQRKSKSITSYNPSSVITGILTPEEEAEERIIEIQKKKTVTERMIKIIEDAIETLSEDRYYIILPLKYFDGKTREEIAEIIGADPSTISRNKNRLINQLQIILFADEVIMQMFE